MNYESFDITEIIESPFKDNFMRLSRHIKRYNDAITALNINEHDCCVDASCGHGYGSFMLAQKARRVYGFDVNNDYLKKASVCFHNINLTFHLYKDFYNSPLREMVSINKIICIETLEHVSKEVMMQFAKSLIDLLCSGGDMYIALPLGNNAPNKHNEYHVNEPSVDVLYKLFRPYFKQINIDIHDKKSFGKISDECNVTLKGRR